MTAAVSASGTAAAVQPASVNTADLVSFDEDDTSAQWSADNSTSIAFSGTTVAVSGTGAAFADGVVKITAGGTYVLTGTLSEGQVVVDVQDDSNVQLVLNGADLHNSSSAPVYIKEAGKVIMTLQGGTTNSVSDGKTYVFEDETTDEPSAAIFSKADLTINGTGALTVEANYKDGITGKDDVKIVSGVIEVQAADDGIVGKDLVAIKDGSFTIRAEGDGIKSTNSEEADKGFIAISAGTFDIEAGSDGIQAETRLVADNGTYKILTGGGSGNAEVKAENDFGGKGGGMFGGRDGQLPPDGTVPGEGTVPPEPSVGSQSGLAPAAPQAADPAANNGAASAAPAANNGTEGTAPAASGSETTQQADGNGSTDSTATESESASAKGLKAGGDLILNGGGYTIDSKDDALHSNSSVSVTGGEMEIAAGDDGVHADNVTAISGGKIDITKSYEGIEGGNIVISGGETHVTASDDGVNVAGGNDANAAAGTARQDDFSSTGSHLLTLSGGYLYVDAAGDGLDSNGSITMSGGTVVVNGPTNDGNGALDYDGTFEITGGDLIVAGSAGMAQAPSDESGQPAVSMTFTESQKTGTLVHLQDTAGNTIATFAPAKDFRSVVISSSKLKVGTTYTLSTGGTSTGTAVDGRYTDGAYNGGTEVVTFKLESTVTWVNESGVTTANTGRGMGGMGGGRPQRGMQGGAGSAGNAGGTGSTGSSGSSTSGTGNGSTGSGTSAGSTGSAGNTGNTGNTSSTGSTGSSSNGTSSGTESSI
ncbi:carbohydrate-binding domain-containing protein [Shouchella clausii]